MPETIRYDLLHEPWIPCERPDGSRVLVGIEEALVEAHTFAALHDESPLVTATLHRLLLAVLQRVFLPRTEEDWVALWKAPSFDATKVRSYLTSWRQRFDLFHPERPFLQVANLREVLLRERGKDPEPTQAWRLAMEVSPYSNAIHLIDPLPDNPELSPREAALSLLAFLAFTPGGRIQNESDSWGQGTVRGGAVVLVRGNTLQRTLLCNLVCRPQRQPEDVPPWERETPTRRIARAPYGLVDLLVWPSRRVQLLTAQDEGGSISVRDVVTAAGERLESDVPDPMFAYVVRDPKKPPVAVRIKLDRSVWRDAAALFDATTGADAHRRPLACTQLAELIRNGEVPRTARFQVELFGLAHSPPQAPIHLWRADRMPLPPALLTDGTRIAALRDALSIAESLGEAIDFKVLGTLAENALAPSNRDAHKDDIRHLKLALGAMPAYWSILGQAFGAWLDALGSAADLDAALTQWKRILRATARKVVVDAELHLGTGARALQAGAKAERVLRRVLREVLGNDLEATVGPAATMTTTTEGASP